jgi:hypothetical protein
MTAHVPELIPPRVPEFVRESIAEITVTGGGLTLWGSAETAPEVGLKTKVRLDPQAPLIVGRQEGGEIPYMDPSYRSTQIGPDGHCVLTHCGQGRDICVSRGHFMLRGSAQGIAFVNGVPRRGGGIRPPMNGTYFGHPERRWFTEGEEYLVEHGEHIRICLPNGTEVTIAAG